MECVGFLFKEKKRIKSIVLSVTGGSEQPVSAVPGSDWWVTFQARRAVFVCHATLVPQLNQFAAGLRWKRRWQSGDISCKTSPQLPQMGVATQHVDFPPGFFWLWRSRLK